MAVHSKKINPAGGPVEVEIHAGNRHILSYKCVLMNGDGSDQQTVLTGDTVDTLPDKVVLPMTSAALAGKFLGLSGILAPVVATGANQNFNVEVSVRQDGAVIGGAPVVVSGVLQSAIPILEHVEL